MKKVESKSIPVPIDAATIEEETFVIAAIAEEAPRIARANIAIFCKELLRFYRNSSFSSD